MYIYLYRQHKNPSVLLIVLLPFCKKKTKTISVYVCGCVLKKEFEMDSSPNYLQSQAYRYGSRAHTKVMNVYSTLSTDATKDTMGQGSEKL